MDDLAVKIGWTIYLMAFVIAVTITDAVIIPGEVKKESAQPERKERS